MCWSGRGAIKHGSLVVVEASRAFFCPHHHPAYPPPLCGSLCCSFHFALLVPLLFQCLRELLTPALSSTLASSMNR